MESYNYSNHKTFDLRSPIRVPRSVLMRPCSDGSFLALAPDMPNWIVLRDELEIKSFELIRQGCTLQSIKDTMCCEYGHYGLEALKRVLIEICVQRFFSDTIPIEAGAKCNMTIYLTNRCNLVCAHCYRYQEKPCSELSSTQWFEVVGSFSKLPDCGRFVTFSGGECTLRKDFISILRHSSKLSLKNVLLTNGTLINAYVANSLIEHCYEIQISIDGCDAVTHDSVRGQGTFAAAMHGLYEVATAYSSSRNHPRIALAVTPLPNQMKRMESCFPSFFARVNDMFNGELLLRMSTDLKPGRHFSGLNTQQRSEYKARSRQLKATVLNEPDWNDKIDGERFAPNVKVLNCGFGQNISIQPNGDVFGCYDAKKEFMGNVVNSSLVSIRALLNELYTSTLVYYSNICIHCDLKYICGGGCRLHNKKYKGAYQSPYCCQVDLEWKQRIYDLMAKKRNWSWREHD